MNVRLSLDGFIAFTVNLLLHRSDFSTVGWSPTQNGSSINMSTPWHLHVHAIIVQSHGIPEEVIDNTIHGAKEFFALPDRAKMEVGSI